MDKINPASYITDTDPAVEAIINTSNWYTTEYQIFDTDDNSKGWYIAQGWIYVGPSAWDTTVNPPVEIKSLYSRRVLVPERALASLVSSFTNAYNEGRQLNDQRYDEIVTLFTVMLDKTEDNLNSLESADTTYDALIETLISGLSDDYDAYKANVDGIFDDYGDSERARINLQFDNMLTVARASAISRGIYNTTTWDSISAGVERERAVALTDLEDKILERQLSVEDRAYTLKDAMRGKILAARDRLRETAQNLDLQRVGLRNQVLSALTAFMERREDTYPDMASIGQLTASLGMGAAASQAPS